MLLLGITRLRETETIKRARGIERDLSTNAQIFLFLRTIPLRMHPRELSDENRNATSFELLLVSRN